MPRPIQAVVDLTALRNNLRIARRKAAHARTFAVVKANAYGHGLLRAARAFSEAEGFAILEIDNAVRLREAGYPQPILLLEGAFDARELRVAAEQGFACAIHDPEQAQLMRDLPAGARLDVFVKLNTGMNRLGISPSALGRVMNALRGDEHVRSLTFMTHFACADDARGVSEQWQEFSRATQHHRLPSSAANSAAVLRYPEVHADWIRPGIMLYGSSPFADVSADQLGLRPAITLVSEIIGVQDLRPGDAVGYGATFVASRPMRIGIVACGYADGYPRHAPSGTPILVAGVRTETVGRVSMDMLCADISAIPQAGRGSQVTLWGDGLPADEVAAAAGTVSYELFCALAARVPVIERE
ncbi:MAG: alanine racemase [Betaproteobacteria bacterium]|nr:MAG: alanine racemase [Betaproteobacteria bacterium]